MKGKTGKGPPSTDLLVCFPTRAHLTLMPPKSSPVRPSSESTKGQSSHHHHNHRHSRHRRNRSSIGIGQGNSPVLWAKNKPMNNDISEPTSPKVTCAGQIKVRPKPTNSSSCKNWQSVMEEIERVHHNSKKHKKRPPWAEALGFKKDVMQFLTCLRNISFDFRCFGGFPTNTGITSDDEDDDEDDEDDEVDNNDQENESSKPVFSKWFMVLQEKDKDVEEQDSYRKSSSDEIIAPPPPNALLLMRCRSAPAKSWLEEREEEERKIVDEVKAKVEAMEKEEIEKHENLILRYGAVEHDLGCKFSSDIAKETWIVGGIRDSLSRSRSWKS